MLDRDGTAVPATLLRPRTSVSPLPGWVVMHGITRAGRAHPQLVRFTRAVASTGAAVIIPEVPEWRQLDLAPHLTTPTIRSAIDSLQTTPGVHEGPFGLVGFSFGAPHTVAAAGDPALRADVATAVGFGGYCDPRRTIHFMMTGQHEHNGDTIYLRPDPYGRWIVAANYLTDSVGYEGAIDVADALRRLATLAGDTGTPAWSPQYDRAKVQMGEGLAPDSRELFDLIAPPSHREPDVEEGAKLAGPYSQRAGSALSRIWTPSRRCPRSRARSISFMGDSTISSRSQKATGSERHCTPKRNPTRRLQGCSGTPRRIRFLLRFRRSASCRSSSPRWVGSSARYSGARRLLKKYGGSRTWRLRAFRQGTTRRRSLAGTAAEGGGPKRRDDGSTAQPPCAQHQDEMIKHVYGLRWHGPISDVGAPLGSDGYAFEAQPRIWGRGIPNAARGTSSTAF